MTPQTVLTKTTRANKRLEEADPDEEPLIDTTESLPLRSKKMFRQKRKNVKKSEVEAAKPHLHTLPPEIILEILSCLRPTDLIRYQRTSKYNNAFVQEHENSLVKDVISIRYPILSKCFPRSFYLADVDESYHPILQDPRQQQRLRIHKGYQHILPADSCFTCSCLTCVLAWNNLCLILDLAHWTRNAIAVREPIPIIKRGSNPDWNAALVARHADIVRKALASPLIYALILQQHLQTIVTNIQKSTYQGVARFNLSTEDIKAESDAFASRQGPNYYEFPFQRDIYYSLHTYLPNRRWSKEESKWLYYPVDQHYRDLEWMKNMADREKAQRATALSASRHARSNYHEEGTKEIPQAEMRAFKDVVASSTASLFSDGAEAT